MNGVAGMASFVQIRGGEQGRHRVDVLGGADGEAVREPGEGHLQRFCVAGDLVEFEEAIEADAVGPLVLSDHCGEFTL